jgi:hydroxymethylpyrimidine/phosphomethylpyrimidine kinase
LNPDERQPVVLSIAGSDSGAGAGIQADLKTFAAHGTYGVCALTMVTAQSTSDVDEVFQLPDSLIVRQLRSLFGDFRIAAAKTGALGSADAVRAVSDFLKNNRVPLVVDPVMFSKHGAVLIDPRATDALISNLLPLATVVTPNLHEAAAISGVGELTSRSGMLEAAQRMSSFTSAAIVVKGGHLSADASDLLWMNNQAVWIEGSRVISDYLHGTGCTFSAAIAANIGFGLPIEPAVRKAKAYVRGAISSGREYGRGYNPVNHFWQLMPGFGDGPSALPEGV